MEVISNRDLDLLISFASLYGPNWKHVIRKMWEESTYPGLSPTAAKRLSDLHKNPAFGRDGLTKFRVSREVYL